MSVQLQLSTIFNQTSLEPYESGGTGYNAPRSVFRKIVDAACHNVMTKENWPAKLKDAEIRSKYYDELKAVFADKLKKSPLKWNGDLAQWTLSALDNRASLITKEGLTPTGVFNVWSIQLAPETLEKTHDMFKTLETRSLSAPEVNWHPANNNTVLDIVHPSLYCYSEGQTAMLKDKQRALDQLENIDKWKQFTEAELESIPEEPTAKKLKSSDNGDYDEIFMIKHRPCKHRWLPAVYSTGQARWLTYINNLDPFENTEMYEQLANLVDSYMIPAWNQVFSDLLMKEGVQGHFDPTPMSGDYYVEEDEDEDENENKRFKPYEVPPYTACLREPYDLKKEHPHLQIVVKLVTTKLNEKQPFYEGKLHVEGVPEEQIVATGICYLESEGLTEPTLEFQRAVDEPAYEQNDWYGVSTVYDMDKNLNESLGHVTTKPFTCLAFPNTLRHKLNKYTLQEGKTEGHRRMVVFFLVNPFAKDVVDTSMVPPQQSRMGRETMKKNLSELMSERTMYMDKETKKYFERKINLCEH